MVLVFYICPDRTIAFYAHSPILPKIKRKSNKWVNVLFVQKKNGYDTFCVFFILEIIFKIFVLMPINHSYHFWNALNNYNLFKLHFLLLLLISIFFSFLFLFWCLPASFRDLSNRRSLSSRCWFWNAWSTASWVDSVRRFSSVNTPGMFEFWKSNKM